MEVCILYTRGYKHSSSTGRRGLLLSHEIRLATGVWRTEEPWQPAICRVQSVSDHREKQCPWLVAQA